MEKLDFIATGTFLARKYFLCVKMTKFDCFEVFVLFLNLLCLLKNIEFLQYVTYVKPRTILTSMGNLLWKLSVWTEISDRQATITFQLA